MGVCGVRSGDLDGLKLTHYRPSGTGKTHLAVGIAYRAIQNGFHALFTTATARLWGGEGVNCREGTLRQ